MPTKLGSPSYRTDNSNSTGSAVEVHSRIALRLRSDPCISGHGGPFLSFPFRAGLQTGKLTKLNVPEMSGILEFTRLISLLGFNHKLLRVFPWLSTLRVNLAVFRSCFFSYVLFVKHLGMIALRIGERYELTLVSQWESQTAMVAADHVVRDVRSRFPCVIFTRVAIPANAIAPSSIISLP
jgi:hypothetical protein